MTALLVFVVIVKFNLYNADSVYEKSQIEQLLRDENINAIGISGRDAKLICAKKKILPEGDIGFAGEITEVNPAILTLLSDNGYLPVISPISCDINGHALNINADMPHLRLLKV